MSISVLSTINSSLANLFNEFILYLFNSIPSIIISIIVLVFGWYFSKIILIIARKILTKIGLKEWEKNNQIKKAIYGLSLVEILSQIVRYYVFLNFAQKSASEIGLNILSSEINAILLNTPKWSFSLVFLGFSLIFAHKISENLKKNKLMFGNIGARIAYYLVIYFALTISLPNLGFTQTEILVDSFRLVVAGISLGLAIALGVSFGLALKDPVKDWLKDLTK